MPYEITAAAVIALAKEHFRYAEDGGSSAAFDLMIATEGIASFGELYNAAYCLANELYGPVVPGSGEEELVRRTERARVVWESVQPELAAYAERCRSASYRGWSKENTVPVRAVQL